MSQPDPVVFGDTNIPPDLEMLTRCIMNEVIAYYGEDEPKGNRDRVYLIMNALAIASATVVAGTQSGEAAMWFLKALDLNVKAFLRDNRPAPKGTIQ